MNSQLNRSRRRFGVHCGRLGLPVLLAASVAVNLGLSVRVRQLHAAPVGIVAPGTQLSPLKAQSLEGAQGEVGYGPLNRPTIFYYYSDTCAWCERNWSSVRILSARASRQFRFVAVSLSKPGPATLQRFAGDVQWAHGISGEQQREYGFSGTPYTLVVSSDGRVLRSWPGAYKDRVRRQLEDYFDIRLPELDTIERSRERWGGAAPAVRR